MLDVVKCNDVVIEAPVVRQAPREGAVNYPAGEADPTVLKWYNADDGVGPMIPILRFFFWIEDNDGRWIR